MDAPLKRHEPLYLKHRPQSLDQLVGQESVRTTLSNAINFDRISHAYLFTGPRGTGKTSSARILAKSLNCKAGEKATVSPCQECASCLEIKAGNSPAVFEIDAASNNSVDDARVLIERAPLVAPGGRYKIYIIDECHMLTKEAFNALLKTIEDPPPNVVFVLATTEEHKVIPTIVSRCQRLMFRLVTQDDLLGHLRNVANQEGIEITDAAIDFVARRSGGGLRDALGLLDQASLLSSPGKPVDVSDLLSLLGALHEDVLLEMSASILSRQGQDLLTAANKLLGEGREPAIVVQELARHFLNLAKASYLKDLPQAEAATAKLIVGSPGYVEGIFSQAPQFERSELSQLVEVLDRLEQTCRRSTQPAMHLEVGLLSLCHRQDMLIVRELSERVTRLEQSMASPGAAAQFAARPQPQYNAARPEQRPASPAAAARTEQPAAANSPAPTRPAPQSVPESGASEPSAPQRYEQAAPEPHRPTPAAASANAGISDQPEERDQSRGSGGNTSPQVSPSSHAASATGDAPVGEALPPEEVDRLWGDFLVELQRKSIPTFSMLSAYGFPISITDKELVIGAVSENFQKNLENRIGPIKTACETIFGKSVNVRIKVVAKDTATARPPASSREHAPAAAAAQSGGGDSDEDYEPVAPRQKLDSGSSYARPEPSISTGDDRQSESDNDYGRAATAVADPPQASSQVTARTASPPATGVSKAASADSNEPISADDLAAATANNVDTNLKEAYRLFEGPGSRMIGS